MPPNRITAAMTDVNIITPLRILFHSKFCDQIQLATDANQVIKNEIPQIPVTDASCIKERLLAWVYGNASQVPFDGINDIAYSILHHAAGKISVDINPLKRVASKRSARKDTLINCMATQANNRNTLTGAGIIFQKIIGLITAIVVTSIKKPRAGFCKRRKRRKNTGYIHAAKESTHLPFENKKKKARKNVCQTNKLSTKKKLKKKKKTIKKKKTKNRK